MVKVRLRICEWKNWKRIKTKIRRLTALGVEKHKAYMWANSSKRYCKLAHSFVLSTTLNNSYLRRSGYIGFYNQYNKDYQLKAF